MVIGVDSSGHVRNPPIWMVAARRSKKSGQRFYGVYISREKHEELEYVLKGEPETIGKDWAEKLSAILIYKAILPIFYENDAIFVDYDFQGKGSFIEKYLKKLLRAKYPKIEALANPTVYFIPENRSPEVKDAHIKSQKMRHNILHKSEKDPSFWLELRVLGYEPSDGGT